MKRILFISSLALTILSCANSGNGVEHSDSTNMGVVESNTPTAGTGDTINRGYGASGTGTGMDSSAAGMSGTDTSRNRPQ